MLTIRRAQVLILNNSVEPQKDRYAQGLTNLLGR